MPAPAPAVLNSPCASQVSHHPPAAAHHVISQRGWTLWQEITIASKFRGKYLSIMPLGENPYAAFFKVKVLSLCWSNVLALITFHWSKLVDAHDYHILVISIWYTKTY